MIYLFRTLIKIKLLNTSSLLIIKKHSHDTTHVSTNIKHTKKIQKKLILLIIFL